MSIGFVKLHRKLLDNPIASNPLLIGLFCYLLLLVSHKDHIFFLGKIRIEQKKGEAVISKKEIAKSFGISRGTLDSYLSILQREHIIDIKTTNKYTVLTIVNWIKYQEADIKTTSDGTSTGHQPEHQPDTIKNEKNEREGEEEKTNILSIESNSEADSKNTDLVEKEKKEKIRNEIDFLIETLKTTAKSLGIAYDPKDERKFGKHIITAKAFGEFAESFGYTRVQLAKQVMIASVEKTYWKGPRGGPMTIYQDYPDVFNTSLIDQLKDQKKQQKYGVNKF